MAPTQEKSALKLRIATTDPLIQDRAAQYRALRLPGLAVRQAEILRKLDVEGLLRNDEAALKAANVKIEAVKDPGTLHGFTNDTTPRFDDKAAAQAWRRTGAWFNRTLRGCSGSLFFGADRQAHSISISIEQ